MIFAYLDEFGHIGPWYGADHPKHNASPVFGLAGILIPERYVRSFSGLFLELKTNLLAPEIEKSGKQPHQWEKKGVSLFTPKSIIRYPEVRRTAFRLLNGVHYCGGRVFFYGREKWRGTEDVNSNGLYKTVMAHSLRRIDAACQEIDQNFVVVLDQHSARAVLLDTAYKTMFGTQPTRRLVSPPFEVESHYNQNIQAADWIAAIVGRLWSYRLARSDFPALAAYETYFAERLGRLAVRSTVEKVSHRRRSAVTPGLGIIGEKLLAAGIQVLKGSFVDSTEPTLTPPPTPP